MAAPGETLLKVLLAKTLDKSGGGGGGGTAAEKPTVDTIRFKDPVVIRKISLIPEGSAQLVNNGLELKGSTAPSKFRLEVFTKDLGKDLEIRNPPIKKFATLDYNAGAECVSVVPPNHCSSDLLVLRGRYARLTVVIYGWRHSEQPSAREIAAATPTPEKRKSDAPGEARRDAKQDEPTPKRRRQDSASSRASTMSPAGAGGRSGSASAAASVEKPRGGGGGGGGGRGDKGDRGEERGAGEGEEEEEDVALSDDEIGIGYALYLSGDTFEQDHQEGEADLFRFEPSAWRPSAPVVNSPPPQGYMGLVVQHLAAGKGAKDLSRRCFYDRSGTPGVVDVVDVERVQVRGARFLTDLLGAPDKPATYGASPAGFEAWVKFMERSAKMLVPGLAVLVSRTQAQANQAGAGAGAGAIADNWPQLERRIIDWTVAAVDVRVARNGMTLRQLQGCRVCCADPFACRPPRPLAARTPCGRPSTCRQLSPRRSAGSGCACGRRWSTPGS